MQMTTHKMNMNSTARTIHKINHGQQDRKSVDRDYCRMKLAKKKTVHEKPQPEKELKKAESASRQKLQSAMAR
eukprot:2382047-Rhodomonas_salina.1